MTITWRRLGFLGFMIPFTFWGIAAIGWGHSNFKAFLLAAVTVWVVGRKLNSEAQNQGEEAPHQAFGVPMQWSGVAVAAAGFVLTLL